MKSSAILSLLWCACVTISLYALGWAIVYLLLMGWDLRYVFAYFVYGWTGGLEIPALINLFAIGVAFVVPPIVCCARWRRSRLKSAPL